MEWITISKPEISAKKSMHCFFIATYIGHSFAWILVRIIGLDDCRSLRIGGDANGSSGNEYVAIAVGLQKQSKSITLSYVWYVLPHDQELMSTHKLPISLIHK